MAWVALGLLLGLLALVRPVDHDESQYVAAALLAAQGLPYRDFAYLQTPLQPLLLAPVAALAGGWAWPVLRLVNAALALAALMLFHRTARRLGAGAATAGWVTALFAGSDILLYSAGVARNDALPLLLYAAALPPMLAAAQGKGSPAGALLAGLLLAAAASAKVSYGVPALAYGLYALIDRRHRPHWLALGAVPPALLCLWMYAQAPGAFLFEVLRFPAEAPTQWYLAQQDAWKLSASARLIDAAKFLALGVPLVALVLVARHREAQPVHRLLDLLIVAGLVAALAPVPVWRQYLLPVLPPLMLRLALIWQARPPGRWMRAVVALFAGAGLAYSAQALWLARAGAPMLVALREGQAIAAAWRAAAPAGASGPVASLSPQYLPAAGLAIDPRFAAGPFYFRATGLLRPAEEARLHLISKGNVARMVPPAAILTGAPVRNTSSEASQDPVLIAYARARGWRGVPVAGTGFTLWLR
ncbi:MAG: DUF2029 domain-containing protein [Sphingomonas sp.]|nr:DUF2029 domain-containing protein [Sphingomonas sp.]